MPAVLIGILGFSGTGREALAYESYHDPLQNDKGYCSTCHPGFAGGRSDALHALHTGGSDPVTGECSLCHTGSGRDNPLTMWSIGDGSGNGLGCAGCHGRMYGEAIRDNYRGFPTFGRSKSSGYGLRRHHFNSGVTVCLVCHAPEPPGGAILPESEGPPYYARSDVSLGGRPVDACTNEDTANDQDAAGLDNDGDGLYELNDADCLECTPGVVEMFDGIDNNCNGETDEVEGLGFGEPGNPALLSWNDQPPEGQLYDVMRSDSRFFAPDAPFSACLAVATPTHSLEDTEPVPPGSAFYYLVRNTLISDYGNSSDGSPRLFTVCP